ncbi:hypothetical protein [Flavobacterium hibisci]|uniref:hypothetical protein n=1 Tax=Flavobacterium hibisci TaxID=1914462 RepID=UPI001CBE7901|nr:hypothetical protein [Flavobacterium hibisci]MBZ4043359.1 hypothetical protein [Flavobacterium hibisci]
MIIIYGLIILLILTIIAVLIISFFKRKGKAKIGFLISLPILSLVLYCLFINNLDELLISKSDVKNDLKNAKINLNEDFEILENSVVGFPERFQKTKLKISDADFFRIVLEIKDASDFKESKESWLLNRGSVHNENTNKIIISNYCWNDKFIRESYFKNGEYVAIIVIASFDPILKTLEYERIED